MRIARVETIALRIPFGHGGAPAGWGGRAWSALDTLLVRVDTEDGLTGWGEAFGYSCLGSVKAAVDGMVAPIAIGRDAGDIAGLMRELQQALHLYGRYGITMFALSGLDIALWDIAGKAASLPLYRLLGGAGRGAAAGLCQPVQLRRSRARGRAHPARDRARAIGTSSCTRPVEREVRAAREAAGDGVPLMVDTNCPWTPEEARRMAARLRALRPPLARGADLPARGLPGARPAARARRACRWRSGENACTAVQFRDCSRPTRSTTSSPASPRSAASPSS